MSTVKYAYLGEGMAVDESEFEEMHFKQLLPAEAGRCIKNMKYQTLNAFCEHGRDIERDPNIHVIKLDKKRKAAFRNLCYIGAYYIELEEELDYNRGTYKCYVYFILIPSNSNNIFTFYDVKCA